MQLRNASFSRRRFLTTASALAFGPAILTTRAAAQSDDPASGEPFSFGQLTERMRAAAAAPYEPATPIEGPWAELDYDAYRRIAFDTERAVWAGPETRFELHAYPMGWLFREPVALYEVSDGVARPMQFGLEDFRVDPSVAAALSDGGAPTFPGVAGFRLNTPLNDPARYDEVISFLGASYFRALGRGNTYGISARGLAVNTATGRDEEFPRFSAAWLERPGPGSDQIVFYTALESASVTGAYRFVLRPGETTVIDVTARLFMREDVQQLGIAPLTSMYLFGPSDEGGFDDYRPAVHDSEGLVVTSAGQTSYRQLSNPPRLANSHLAAHNPQYYGLVQRDRAFETFLDSGAHYEKRPSLMVEPTGEWGVGTVRLIEIPSQLEANDNIVAFWVPEKEVRAGDELTFDYRLHWGADPDGAMPDDTARVLRTMTGEGGVSGVEESTGHRKFVIDFAGGQLGELEDPEAVSPAVSASGGEIAESVLSRIADTEIWRLVLEVDAAAGQTVELRADLRAGDAILSETWLYQWQTE